MVTKRKTDTTKCDAGYISENPYLVISSYYYTLKQLPPTNSLQIEFLGSIELSTLTK